MAAAIGIVLAAASLYLMVVLASDLDEHYLRSRFTLPPRACPLATMQDRRLLPWCSEAP